MLAWDITKLRVPDITFRTVWDEDIWPSCGALKKLPPTQGEIWSMRTPTAARGQGTGSAVFRHIISVARQGGYSRLNLETGTHAAFAAAHRWYRSQGFLLSGPFGRYRADPHSEFMTVDLVGNAGQSRCSGG